MAGKHEISLQQIVSINSFDSRWGYPHKNEELDMDAFSFRDVQRPAVSFFTVDSDSEFIVDGSYRGP
jgi:hypothetical protein